MSNPADAFKGTRCNGCDEMIGEGNPVYFNDGERLCDACAEDADCVCSCGNYKKPEYDDCYECHQP